EPRCKIGSTVARVKSVDEKWSPSLWITSLERGLNSCKNGRRVSLNQPFMKRIRLSLVLGTTPSYRERPFWRFSGDTGPNLRDSFKGIEANKSAAGMGIDRPPSE